MKSSVVFGAGAIGLAFLGDLLDRSGYRITFADVRPEVLDWLNARGAYEIRVTSHEGETLRRISNVRGINSSSYGADPAVTDALREAVAQADLVFTAAGTAALASIGRLLGDALRHRVARNDAPLNIVCCENIQDPAAVLRAAILDTAADQAERVGHNLGICRSVISRMTPVVTDPAHILTEAYAEIPVEGSAWLGPPPDVIGVRLVEDFPAYKMRKLIMHNMTHAVAAYLGYFLGKQDVCACVADPLIGRACRRALDEARAVMAAEYALPEDELHAHAEDLFTRYANPNLGHTVPNVARDPVRKLREGDRFHSALSLAEKHGIPSPAAELGAGFALNYDHPDDVSARDLARMIASAGVEAVLRGHCGLDPDRGAGTRVRELYPQVREAVRRMRSGDSEAPVRDLIAARLGR